jgi:N utilization substance protein B
MQTLYGWEVNHDITIGELQSQLDSAIDRTIILYLTDLNYICEVCQYSLVDAAKRMAKYIKTEEDENVNTQIALNRIVVYLNASEAFQRYCKKHKIQSHISPDVVKALFQTLRDKFTYKEYTGKPVPSLDDDKEVAGLIVKKLLMKNKDLEAHLEDHFINFDDDQLLINHIIQKYVEAFVEGDDSAFIAGIEQWEAERKFGHDLLRECYRHNDQLMRDISPNLDNWDSDRLATLDLLLMKMAVCELRYFPTVPVKVTINEYIDISKIYSTPKSKDFVNGVLDKTRIQLQEAGLIVKQGRGLVDS